MKYISTFLTIASLRSFFVKEFQEWASSRSFSLPEDTKSNAFYFTIPNIAPPTF
jgi:hypothetical protein